MDISAELAYGLEMKQLGNSEQFPTARAQSFGIWFTDGEGQ
jgi:hypothetical protein